MSLTDIANKVSLFNPSETSIADFSDLFIKGGMQGEIEIAKDKNNIFILGGSILGDINFSLTNVPHLDSETEQKLISKFSTGSGMRYGTADQAAITKITTMIQGAAIKNNLVMYFPLLSGTSLDSRLAISSDTTTTTVKTVNFNDLAIPGGKSIILLFPKNTASQNLTVNITRPSYTSQICPACIIPENQCDDEGKISKSIFWGMTVGLLILLILVLILCWWCNRSSSKKALPAEI